jgi:hypothetical protein
MDSNLRKARLLHIICLATVPLYAWLAELAEPTASLSSFYWLVAAVALYCVVVGFRFRRRLLVGTGIVESTEKGSSGRWMAGQIIGLLSAEAIVVYGVVTKSVLHVSFLQAAPFYILGAALLLMWTPRKPQN